MASLFFMTVAIASREILDLNLSAPLSHTYSSIKIAGTLERILSFFFEKLT